jgi:predicted CXXCH cytochrome family protein
VKRIAFIALTACALVFAGTSTAFANYGPHGGYATDTDACASCHRAHTAISTVTWTDNQSTQRSSLLISDASSMTSYCYVCHGDGAPGANTNVQSGVYDGNPGGTNSSVDATLNGGGFSKIGGITGPNSATVMSSHNVDIYSGANPTALIRWGYQNPVGGASDLTAMGAFTCTDCHDPHGSSNYRLLKDVVNGTRTGGYVGTNNTPEPWVTSNEEGYPSGGFKKGPNGLLDIANYKPSYTSAQYASNGSNAPTGAMSAWCSACHTAYVQPNSLYDYGVNIPPATSTNRMYYRHPVDVALSVGTAADPEDRALLTQLKDDSGLPLEMGSGQVASGFSYATGGKIWDERGNVSCLTCHRAHGTAATMSGWAATSLGSDGLPQTGVSTTTPLADSNGVDPTHDSALLRYDNRGVCERCHDK